ncbi:MAG: methyltransferase family protein [Candidatus Thorarchaeota archaeon]
MIIGTLFIKYFFIICIILFLIGFFWPLIVVKKSGKDPHGTHEGSLLLTRLSSVSIFLWLGFIIVYVFFNRLVENLWLLYFLYNDISIIIGMILISIGFLFEILGIIALGLNFRIELPTDDTELITSGIYRIMRNPIVFGIFLLVIGSFLIVPTIIVLLISIFNILTFNSKAIDEEKFLLRRFGEDYKNYMNEVGRYLTFRIGRN